MIRRATASDADTLTAIAHAAKRHWGYAEDLIALWHADLTVTADLIETSPVYCAVEDGVAIGFYALSGTGARCELEHLWVRPAHIRSGVGARLFRHAVQVARARGAAALTVASDPNAEGFYRRMGARRVGDVAAHPAGRRLPLLVFELAAR